MRVHYDVDVGGSYGVKRGIKHTVLAGYLARRLGVPVRLIEDRLENMRGGDAHGPERIFDVEVAFDDTGIVRSMKMRALENVGAYAGRSPFQLGKPIGAIVGPYKIKSVQYQRHRGGHQQDRRRRRCAASARRRPISRSRPRIDEVADALGLDRLEVRRRNFIRTEEFPYLIPSGTTYDSGDYHTVVDKVLAAYRLRGAQAERDRLRGEGKLAGIGIAACLEPSGGNATFEPLLNPKITTTTFMDSCRIMVDGMGTITATMHTTSSGQGHETLVGTVIGEVLRARSRLDPRDAAGFARIRCRAARRSAAAWRSCSAARRSTRRRSSKHKLIAIAAHDLGIAPERAVYERRRRVRPQRAARAGARWADLVHDRAPQLSTACRQTSSPGWRSSHVYAGADRRQAADADGRVQMYPCFSFEFHLVLRRDRSRSRQAGDRAAIVIGHDCGTVINPEIVRGMTLGGIAHGIGAALHGGVRL